MDRVFNLVIHHSGFFEDWSGKYDDGIQHRISVDEDKLSYFELRGLIEDIGYIGGYGIIYMRGDEEFMLVEDDKSVTEIVRGLSVGSEINLYLLHDVDPDPKVLGGVIDGENSVESPGELYNDEKIAASFLERRRSPRLMKKTSVSSVSATKPLSGKQSNAKRKVIAWDTGDGLTLKMDKMLAEHKEFWRKKAIEMESQPLEKKSKKVEGMEETMLAEENAKLTKLKAIKLEKCEAKIQNESVVREVENLRFIKKEKVVQQVAEEKDAKIKKVKAQKKGATEEQVVQGNMSEDVFSEEELSKTEIPDASVSLDLRMINEDQVVDSEYYDSDELRSLPEEGEEEVSRARGREFDLKETKDHIDLKIGDRFESAVEFRKAVQLDGIKAGYYVNYLKNESYRVTCCCSKKVSEKCMWRIHASWNREGTAFQIKKIGEKHTCSRLQHNPFVTAEWVAKQYENLLRDNPGWKVDAMKKALQRDYELDVYKCVLYSAKNLVKKKFQGSHMQQYWKIREYANVILERNPGSYVKVQVEHQLPDSPPVFQRIFISYAASIKGFKSGCRRIVGLDGCHLTLQSGLLLSAVAQDANNEMYPVAFAVVESETKEAWKFFLECLLGSLGSQDEMQWVFISDRQKGLIQAVNEIVPGAEHRFCVRHMFQNMLRSVARSGQCKKRFHRCARAYTIAQFNDEMSKLKELNVEAWEWLRKQHEPNYWCRAFFNTASKNDLVVNNICESWNGCILNLRGEPILTMLEMIRRKLMTRLCKKKEWIDNYGKKFGPRILKLVEKEVMKARTCAVYKNGSDQFEVVREGRGSIVNLSTQTCDCGKWSLTGIPCCHVVAVCKTCNKDYEDFIHRVYNKEAYSRAYQYVINPIPHCSLWPSTGLPAPAAPLNRVKPGRPKKKRKKGIDETTSEVSTRNIGGKLKCTRCRELGHNSRTCKNGDKHESKWYKPTGKKPGRPNKRHVSVGEFESHIEDAMSTTTCGISTTCGSSTNVGGVSTACGPSSTVGGVSTSCGHAAVGVKRRKLTVLRKKPAKGGSGAAPVGDFGAVSVEGTAAMGGSTAAMGGSSSTYMETDSAAGASVCVSSAAIVEDSFGE